MSTEAEIIAEIEELGRLTEEQEDILYNIALRQEELGRQPTILLREKVDGSPIYQPMIDREVLTYQLYNHGGAGSHEVVNLIVTLKGMRYVILHSDELSLAQEGRSCGQLPRLTRAVPYTFGETSWKSQISYASPMMRCRRWS